MLGSHCHYPNLPNKLITVTSQVSGSTTPHVDIALECLFIVDVFVDPLKLALAPKWALARLLIGISLAGRKVVNFSSFVRVIVHTRYNGIMSAGLMCLLTWRCVVIYFAVSVAAEDGCIVGRLLYASLLPWLPDIMVYIQDRLLQKVSVRSKVTS